MLEQGVAAEMGAVVMTIAGFGNLDNDFVSASESR
jgi:hypothetical protein